MGVVIVEKISLSCWMAPSLTSSGVWKGALGCGFLSASASIVAALVASSAGEDIGHEQL